jgi:hypothetical protein
MIGIFAVAALAASAAGVLPGTAITATFLRIVQHARCAVSGGVFSTAQ